MKVDHSPEGNLARNLKAAREAHGPMSQEALAEAMTARGFNWRQSTVHSVEKGERRIQLNEAHALSKIFGDAVNAIQRPPDAFVVHLVARRAFQASQALRAAVKENATQLEDFLLQVWALREDGHVPMDDGGVQKLIDSWLGDGIEGGTHQIVDEALTDWSVARAHGFEGNSVMDGMPAPKDLEEARQYLVDQEAMRRELLAELGLPDRGERS